ncbi:sugar phosphate isomerase/epimerase [Herbiconiux sp.]|uniref:sugar phosphate isomerase/epimerase family protein n=1 Tax=Herbiconiux sp. TaxID=1871186 RepID=UPI0025C0BABF|nr:sugar phosphate isomerase/epimerase [Herbiconiux sp.]
MTDEFSTRGTGIERSQSVMWAGTVRTLRLADQVRAAALAGFGGISITPLGWSQALSEGISSGDMRALCADNGIERIHLDPFTRWSALWQPANLDPAVFPLSFFAFDADDFLRIAEALGAASMTAIATFPHGAIAQEQMTEDFARLCDRAADHGLHCSLEFIPLDWGVPDLETAWSIVRDADRANSGIVLDTWCFQRSGSSLELLESIPGDRIDFVQLADGLARVPKNRSWVEDNLDNRLPPGLGAFPLDAILSTLARTGGLGSVSPELFAWQLDQMTPEQIADLSRSSLAATADGAGIAHDLGPATPGWHTDFERAERGTSAVTAAPRSHL